MHEANSQASRKLSTAGTHADQLRAHAAFRLDFHFYNISNITENIMKRLRLKVSPPVVLDELRGHPQTTISASPTASPEDARCSQVVHRHE